MDKEHLRDYQLSTFLYCLFLLGSFSYSQEPKVFSWADFELNGKVKSSLVITDYGKESFEFNEQGLLTKTLPPRRSTWRFRASPSDAAHTSTSFMLERRSVRTGLLALVAS